jgi:dihydropteroate synthase
MIDWICRDRYLTVGQRPLIMGILNVTPDSFSDGGRHADTPAAIDHAHRMIADGADIIDIGGESTRPGAAAVGIAEEIARVVPVITELRTSTDTILSVDTTKADVARAALDAGAHIVNDVSALTHDAAMADVTRDAGAGVVLMHRQGTPRTMQQAPQYGDVSAEVNGYLARRVEALVQSGSPRQTLAVDPGIGFGKTVEHNVALIQSLPDTVAIGCPVIVGLSRKSFLGKLSGREVGDRLAASLAGLVVSVLNGAHIMRVHDVAASRDAAMIAATLGA